MEATVTTPDLLRVVTTAKWLAEDLATAGTIPVILDYGLELPASTEGTAWWCSGRHAARLMASGVNPGFLSPGPTFTADLPWTARRRKVWAGRLKDLPMAIGPSFCKAAEAKLPELPAAEYAYSGLFEVAARRAKLDADDYVQMSGLRDLKREYRCFVTRGEVTAISPYLIDGVTWESLDPEATPGIAEAKYFASVVVKMLGTRQPPGYVLDVGVSSDGRFMVVEANASWSSNPYHADPAGVLESVLASQSTDPTHERWRWEPIARLRNHAQPLPGNS